MHDRELVQYAGWAGPVAGVVLPLFLLAPLIVLRRRVLRHVFLFSAGFSLLANGVYIGAGAFLQAGDCRRLLALGAPLWSLVLFGLIAAGTGLFVWHRMGPVRHWFAAGGQGAVSGGWEPA